MTQKNMNAMAVLGILALSDPDAVSAAAYLCRNLPPEPPAPLDRDAALSLIRSAVDAALGDHNAMLPGALKNRIATIKVIRSATGMGLKEAKDWLDREYPMESYNPPQGNDYPAKNNAPGMGSDPVW